MSISASASFQAASAAAFSPLLLPGIAAPVLPLEDPAAPSRIDARIDLPLDELNFRHLQGADQIGSIVHLRKEIQLPAAAVADPLSFVAREKKETRRVS